MISIGNQVRSLAPPVLALGLALALVHPLDVGTQATQATASHLPMTVSSNESASAPALALPRAAVLPSTSRGVTQPVSYLAVSVPAVAFIERIGRIHTAVLVNAAEPSGVASVVGVEGCQVDAESGVVAWLDCVYTGDDETLTVAVVLSDARRFTHTTSIQGSVELNSYR